MVKFWRQIHGQWIFIALWQVLLAFLLLGHHFLIAIILTIFFLIRIFRSKSKILWWSVALFGVIFAFYCQQQLPKTPIVSSESEVQVVLYADMSRVNGDFLTFQGQSLVHGQWIRVTGGYTLKSEAEKKFFQENWYNLKLDTKSTLSAPNKATNKGQFDQSTYLWQQQRIRTTVKITKIRSLHRWEDKSLRAQVRMWRQRLNLHFSTYPKPLSTYLKGLIIGQFHEDSTLRQDLSTLGVIHLFSLSGLHVFILVGLLSWLATKGRIPEEDLAWVFLVFLPIYGLLAGSGTGIRRAVLMVCLTILLTKLKLHLSTLDKLSIVLMIQLWLNPYTLFSLGGLLSYLLTFALIFNQHQGLVQQQIMLSLCSLPVILYFQYEWHLLNILLNLAMIPFFETVIIPVVLICSVFSTTNPLVILFGQLLEVLDQSLHFLSEIRLFQISFGQPPFLAVLLCVLLSFWIMNQPHFKRVDWSRYLYWGLLCISFTSLHNPIYGQVTIIDIGQGDSILITTPLRRKVILIDTGGQLSLPKKAWQQGLKATTAQRVTVPYLKQQGIRKIDAIFITHQDADHLGDLPTILQHFSVEKVVFAQGLDKNPHFYQKVSPYLQRVKLQSVLAGQRVTVGKLHFDVVHPFVPGSGKNEDSLILYSEIQQKRWLFMGDAYQDGEQEALAHYNLSADYIKLGHHGSKTSSGLSFLEATQPKLALISSGRNNRYGHPSPETVQTLQQLAIPFLNTQTSGMISWNYSGLEFSKWTTFGTK